MRPENRKIVRWSGVVGLVALAGGFAAGTYGAEPVKEALGLVTEDPASAIPTEVLGVQQIRDDGPEELLTAGALRTFRYGPDDLHLLDVVRSAATPLGEPQPVIVYLHSGGWTSGSRVNLPDFIRAQADAGWTVVSADHRLAPHHPFPAPNEDVDRLLRWLQVHAEALGIDPDRVVLAGSSSGAHLALVAGGRPGRFVARDLPGELEDVEPRIAAVVAVVPPTNLAALIRYPADGLIGGSTLAYLGCSSADACDPERVSDASPKIDPGVRTPPALFLYGELDEIAVGPREGEAMRIEWERAGGPATVSVAPGVGHNLQLDAGVDPALLSAFLQAVAG